MVRSARSILPLMVAGLLITTVGLTCGDDAPTSTPEQTIAPRDALRRAVDELLNLQSAAFTLEHQTGETTLFPGLVMRKAYGVVDIPDKFSLTVEAESAFPRSYLEIKVVTIEDQVYMTDVITGEWLQVSPQILPFTFVDLSQTLANIIEAVDSPILIGTETRNGQDAYHINGRVLSEDLAGLVPVAGDGFEVKLDLWVEQSRGLLLQILISGKVVPTDGEDTVRLLSLDDVNVPVEISPPR